MLAMNNCKLKCILTKYEIGASLAKKCMQNLYMMNGTILMKEIFKT